MADIMDAFVCITVHWAISEVTSAVRRSISSDIVSATQTKLLLSSQVQNHTILLIMVFGKMLQT